MAALAAICLVSSGASGAVTLKSLLEEMTDPDANTYLPSPRYTARLYVKENDPDLVSAFEDAVGSLCASFEPHREWVESEGCMEHLYLFTLLPLKEE